MFDPYNIATGFRVSSPLVRRGSFCLVSHGRACSRHIYSLVRHGSSLLPRLPRTGLFPTHLLTGEAWKLASASSPTDGPVPDTSTHWWGVEARFCLVSHGRACSRHSYPLVRRGSSLLPRLPRTGLFPAQLPTGEAWKLASASSPTDGPVPDTSTHWWGVEARFCLVSHGRACSRHIYPLVRRGSSLLPRLPRTGLFPTHLPTGEAWKLASASSPTDGPVPDTSTHCPSTDCPGNSNNWTHKAKSTELKHGAIMNQPDQWCHLTVTVKIQVYS